MNWMEKGPSGIYEVKKRQEIRNLFSQIAYLLHHDEEVSSAKDVEIMFLAKIGGGYTELSQLHGECLDEIAQNTSAYVKELIEK